MADARIDVVGIPGAKVGVRLLPVDGVPPAVPDVDPVVTEVDQVEAPASDLGLPPAGGDVRQR